MEILLQISKVEIQTEKITLPGVPTQQVSLEITQLH